MLKIIADGIKSQVSSQVLNHDAITELALAAFFAGGHILLSGPTGLGKTRWARAFAGALGLSYGEVIFADDCQEVKPPHGTLIPQVYQADITGCAPAWTNPSVIEAIDRQGQGFDFAGSAYPLPTPHFIIVSCNETQSVAKAVADRFMMKLYVNYPGIAAEKQILQMHHAAPDTEPAPVCTPDSITQAKREVQAVAVDDAVFNYIVSIAETTRRIGVIQTGASTRASISLMQAAKAYAAINGREYATIDDVRNLAIPVLRHRVTLRPETLKQGVHTDQIIESIVIGRRM